MSSNEFGQSLEQLIETFFGERSSPLAKLERRVMIIIIIIEWVDGWMVSFGCAAVFHEIIIIML